MKARQSVFLTLAACACMTTTFADTQQYNSNRQDDQVSTSNPYYSSVLPAAGKRVDNGNNITIGADFLYWEARQSKMGFALDGVAADPEVGVANLTKGQEYFPNFSYEPAFRVMLAKGLPHDAWSMNFRYTWYKQNFHPNSVSHLDNSVDVLTEDVDGMSNTGVFASPYTFAEGKWDLQMNVLDFELGRASYYSKYFSVDYAFGLKAAWQDQHNTQLIHYTNDDDVSTHGHMVQAAKSFGVGLRAATHMEYSFTNCFSLYGDLAANTLSTWFNNTADLYNQTVTDPDTKLYSIRDDSSWQAIQPVIEGAIGINWDIWWSNDSYLLSLKLGWEGQWWLRNNPFNGTSEIGKVGDLSLQGLVVSASFTF